MKVTKADLRLYAITDRQWLGGKDFYMVVEQVLKNGATFLQLREKNQTDCGKISCAVCCQ